MRFVYGISRYRESFYHHNTHITETCDLSTIIGETEYDDDDKTGEDVSEIQTMEFRQDKQSGEHKFLSMKLKLLLNHIH